MAPVSLSLSLLGSPGGDDIVGSMDDPVRRHPAGRYATRVGSSIAQQFKKPMTEAERLESHNKKMEERLEVLRKDAAKRLQERGAIIDVQFIDLVLRTLQWRVPTPDNNDQDDESGLRNSPKSPRVKTPESTKAHVSLLDGSFDEDDSRQSFLAALSEWRAGKTGSRNEEGDGGDGATCTAGTNTVDTDMFLPPDDAASTILFGEHGGISYLDRLLLERFRTAEPQSSASQGNHARSQSDPRTGEVDDGKDDSDSELDDPFWIPASKAEHETKNELRPASVGTRAVVAMELLDCEDFELWADENSCAPVVIEPSTKPALF
ncbi:hypothetical protein HK405_010669 [Cladochytrium tenue]|nr:hypothetical protein HK405_010669 [Cladochytrium tenue]